MQLERVGIVFSGGPAPGANAVIAAATSALRRAGVQVFGFLSGYTHLQGEAPLRAGEHYRVLEDRDLWGLRNQRGVLVGTARANPGREVRGPDDLRDPARTRALANVLDRLGELEVQALVSIGGDGTLRTANLLYRYQQHLPAERPRVRVVHIPKTIDNDYRGIDFTFGFFTAVDVMSRELQNLRADALATGSYYVVETMGRHAGWLAYGVAVAGEAHMVVGAEDVVGELADGERLNVDALADRIVELIVVREARGKTYGTVVLAEGLAELLPDAIIAGLPRDEHGQLSLGKLDLAKLMAVRVAERYARRTGKQKKLTGVQLGYESRCAPPHAFDVLLGCQLGLGAQRALCELALDGCMVSLAGQLQLQYVPFDTLVDPHTLMAQVRFVERGSDFHRLATQLGTQLK